MSRHLGAECGAVAAFDCPAGHGRWHVGTKAAHTGNIHHACSMHQQQLLLHGVTFKAVQPLPLPLVLNVLAWPPPPLLLLPVCVNGGLVTMLMLGTKMHEHRRALAAERALHKKVKARKAQ